MDESTASPEYSILLLAVDEQIIPFEPLEWRTNQQEWATVRSPSPAQTIRSHAVALFQQNQSQHGTNVLVRVDLQHTPDHPDTGPYTSTSITRLPDDASQTPSLIAATFPGGQAACASLLDTLVPRRLAPRSAEPTPGPDNHALVSRTDAHRETTAA